MKASRPVRRGAVGKGAGKTGYLVSRLPNTNRIEHLATTVWRWLERPERGITVIEHYQPRGVCVRTATGECWQFAEEFDQVEMTRTTDERFEKPVWKPSTRMAIEEIIGQPFAPLP